MCVENATPAPCIFEYVYFARPDSIMDGVSVYESRLQMGKKLAEKIKRVYPDHGIDVVIPIPDTSRTSALQAAYDLDRPFREGFIKNRYIARTFIMPGQASRKKSVRLKLNTIKSEFAGRNVLLVDDSIVRGTTANEIVQMARDAGAKKVFFCSAAPPIRYPNIYGIDIPTREELIAYGRVEEEIAAKIGCDWVVYQDLKDLEDSVMNAVMPESPLSGKLSGKAFEILKFFGFFSIASKYLSSARCCSILCFAFKPSTRVVSAGNMLLGSELAMNTLRSYMICVTKMQRYYEMEMPKRMIRRAKRNKAMMGASLFRTILGCPRREKILPANLFRTTEP